MQNCIKRYPRGPGSSPAGKPGLSRHRPTHQHIAARPRSDPRSSGGRATIRPVLRPGRYRGFAAARMVLRGRKRRSASSVNGRNPNRS